MVYMEPEFEPAKIPEDEVYEGTEVDPNVRARELRPYRKESHN